MAKRKSLTPVVTMPNGERFVAVTLRISERFDNGVASELQHIPHGSMVEMPVERELILAYVREGSLEA